MAQFPGGIEINPVNSMLGPNLMGAANLITQLKQVQVQQEEIKAKKKEAKFDAASRLFKEAPDALKVQIYNKTIRPMWSEHMGTEIPELNIEDVKKPSFSDMLKTIDGIDSMKNLDAAGKKQLKTRVFAEQLASIGQEKAGLQMLAGDFEEDRPAARSYQFAGTDPQTGNAVIFDTKSGQFQTQAIPGPLAPKTRETKLSPTVVNQLTEGAAVLRMLPDVNDAIEKNRDVFGPVGGRARKANPYDTKAQTIQAQMKASSQAFGRFMEGGVLRKEDELKYEKMFPQLSDTPDVAVKKLAVVNRLLAQRYNDMTSTLKNTGYQTAGLIQSATPPAALAGPQTPTQSQKFKIISVEGN